MGTRAVAPTVPSATLDEAPSLTATVRASVANVLLRVVTLASKFALLIVLARYYTPADVGMYGLVAGTTGIAIYLLGMDYYVFNTREILARKPDARAPLIRDQAVFHVLVYSVVLPAMLGLFVVGILPWRLALWFYPILVFEHLSQEAYRLLIVLSRPIVANAVLFVRAGAWVVPLVLLAIQYSFVRHVSWVLAAWAAGVAVSVGVAVRVLARMDWSAARVRPIDWRAMRRTVVGALPFLTGSLALRGIEYSDRFFLEHFAGVETVGIYTLYFSIANVVQTFVIASVIQLLYPRLVEAYQHGRHAEYRQVMKRMTAGGLAVAVIGAIAAGVAARPILAVVRPVYATHVEVLWLLLLAAVLGVAAMFPNYALYVRRRDRLLLVANLAGVATSLTLNAVLVPRYGIAGAGATAAVSSAVVFLACLLGALSARRVGHVTR